MEGGIPTAGATEFAECFTTTWKHPYILRLALSAGIGGLLFGYDTGVISGALLYIRDDFPTVDKNTFLQETIVSMAVAGAIFGAAVGGWMNDKFGRKISILVADFLFFAGALIMAFAPNPGVIILGRIFVGLGVGMASMTAPLYISEASPARIRGALVSMNALLITGGQFVSYLINLAFTKVDGTWRWMLGIAGLPALIQFILMLSLPESPRWLYRNNKTNEAVDILRRLFPPEEVEKEVEALRASVENEKEESIGEGNMFTKLGRAWGNVVVRRGLIAGVGLQVAQQFVGINTVMYYSPTIVQLAGFASNKTALALSLITSGLNAVGSIVSIFFVDRAGRRKLLLLSLFGIIFWLVVLCVVFEEAAIHAPPVSKLESTKFGGNSTCPSYLTAPDASTWNCMKCLQGSTECGFCSSGGNHLQPGACLAINTGLKKACEGEQREWFTRGCPNSFGFLALVGLALYIISYSPGMGSVPWLVNSEIYPLKYRGFCGGTAAVANWVSNLVVSLSFLSLTQSLGSSYTFLLFAGFSIISLVFIYFCVPETKGLPMEEVERMLQRGFKPWPFNKADKGEINSLDLKPIE